MMSTEVTWQLHETDHDCSIANSGRTKVTVAGAWHHNGDRRK
jgi:hypothetical protein